MGDLGGSGFLSSHFLFFTFPITINSLLLWRSSPPEPRRALVLAFLFGKKLKVVSESSQRLPTPTLDSSHLVRA